MVKFVKALLRERSWCRKLIRFIWIAVPSFVVLIVIYIYLVILNPYNLFGGMPPLTQIENPENDLSSEVISADGVLLGRYIRFNRSQLTYDQLPPALVKTLIISEDHRFYDHSGMDFPSYVRVIWGLLTFNSRGGGSTLTQQTAKNLFSTRGDELQGKLGSLGGPVELLISKTKEWIIAVRLERNLTKEEIIALYLNTVPFSNSTYGIKVAAETYFSKSVSALNIQEITVLVGLLQSNYAYDPVNFPERSLSKRNSIFRKLLKHEFIKTRREYDSLCAMPLKLNFRVQNQNEGLATYFRSVIKPELLKWSREHGYDLYESGLKIYTTIDSRMQYLAEVAVRQRMGRLQGEFEKQWGDRDPWERKSETSEEFLLRKFRQAEFFQNLVKKYGKDSPELTRLLNTKRRMRVFTWSGDKDTLFSSMDSIRYYNRFLHSGLLAMNPNTGEIKSWVGGINHRYFKFDHVYQSRRQPGSTFKAFVYGKAMEDGYSPCDQFADASPSISINGEIYQVANSSGGYGDGTKYSLRRAMAKSLNSVTMQLMERLKPENVADFAVRLGITSELDPVYSLGLGTSEVSLFELVGAYSSFVNDGIYTKPFYITRIEDKNGNILEIFTPKSQQVINKETARKMIYMLKGGVEEEGGTSGALSERILLNNEVGGKTGTTNNASDGWYVGLTHNLVTGVWVGGDEPSIRFSEWKYGSGGRTALPIWSSFMEGIYMHPETGYGKGYFNESDTLEYLQECGTDDMTIPHSF
jgi:penicillin-binding protein 1A